MQIGHTVADDEDAYRCIEFAYALRARAKLQFRSERELEESVGDLGIGEAGSLGAPSSADFSILGLCRADDCGDSNEGKHRRHEPAACHKTPPGSRLHEMASTRKLICGFAAHGICMQAWIRSKVDGAHASNVAARA